MPQLPSGRHIALGLEPLNELVDRARTSQFVTELLLIVKPAHLLPYVELIHLEPHNGDNVQLMVGSQPMPGELRQVRTGVTLATWLEAARDWSNDDQQAFRAFLSSPRVARLFEETLTWVHTRKEELKQHPDPLVQWQVMTWLKGCHPLQDGDTDEDYPE